MSSVHRPVGFSGYRRAIRTGRRADRRRQINIKTPGPSRCASVDEPRTRPGR